METICIRIKVKDGSLENVRKWFQTLRERQEEVLETLENEGVVVESVFLEKSNKDYFLIYYMKAISIAQAREVFRKSILPIDKFHKECLKQFCEERQELEQLLDLNRN